MDRELKETMVKHDKAAILIVAAACLAGCAGNRELGELRPEVDLSPVGCGYKWFQSGYSPTLEMPCEQDRSTISGDQKTLARTHAWEVASIRCPNTCPPVELEDSIETVDRFEEGVCRDGFAYFTTRVFFQCGGQAL